MTSQKPPKHPREMTTKEAAEFLFHPKIREKVADELAEYEAKVPRPPHRKSAKKSTSE